MQCNQNTVCRYILVFSVSGKFGNQQTSPLDNWITNCNVTINKRITKI